MNRTSMVLAVAGGVLGLGNIALAADADRAYSAELLADAAGRTSLAQSGAPGYDGQFYISDAAGNYRLSIGGLVQLRYYGNFNDEDDDAGRDDYTGGFDLPRAVLSVQGNVISPDLSFKVSGDFGGAELGNVFDGSFDEDDNFVANSNDGDFGLLEAWIKYSFSDQTYALAGQFRAPVLFEEIVDPGMQMVIERSIVNEYFSPGYTQGLALGYESDSFRLLGSVNDGAASGNTPYNTEGADVGVTARADFKISGDWDQFKDLTSFRNSSNAFRVGAGIHWETGGDTGAATGSTIDGDYLLYSIDAGYEGNGWNVFGTFIGAHATDGRVAGVGTDDDRDDFAVMVQGGVFLTEQAELYGRWETLFLDEDADNVDDELSFLTVGANYYITPNSHAAKVSADVVWSFNETAGVLYNPQTTGLLGSTEDNEILLRLQFQLMF